MAEENGHDRQQAKGAATSRSRRGLIFGSGVDSTQALTARRRLLRGAGAMGLAAAAVAAEQIARPGVAQAGTDGDVVLGQTNTEGSTTVIQNTALASTAFSGQAQGGGIGVSGSSTSGVGVSGSSTSHWGVSATSQKDTALQAQSSGGIGVVGVGTASGVYGQSGSTNGFALTREGVRGFTDSGTDAGVAGYNVATAGGAPNGGAGVSGHSNIGIGVDGSSDNFWGVHAASQTDTALQAEAANGTGVKGFGFLTGVYGQSGTNAPFGLTKDGVRGRTDSASDSGVLGENLAGGYGVSGTTTSSGGGGNAAVAGTNGGTGPGVYGAGGIGVLAQATGTGATALKVQGAAVFSRSGVVTIAAGQSSATVTGVALTAASLVLATLQQHATGVYVVAAVPKVSASSFTMYLNKAPAAAVKVAWFVVN